MIFLPSATSLPVDIRESGPAARFPRAYHPRLAKLLHVLQQPALSRGEVVLGYGIEVTAKAAQALPIRRGCRHLEKADAVPEHLDPNLRVHDYAVGRTVDV